MGLRYVVFRIFYVIQIKTGYFKKKFPTNPPNKTWISLSKWRAETPAFFFKSKSDLRLPKSPNKRLKDSVEQMKNGEFIFFNKEKVSLGKDYDWISNPTNGYRYDLNAHFSHIEDFSKEKGDIKFVWEKARFSFLYDLIRYDYHFDTDESQFAFDQIIDFIEKNPINKGPNYKCSQETSLRILNWTFALYYYKDSEHLTEQVFDQIMNSIYWQLKHVYNNIQFSRIAVRNNHAITETLMLYLSKLLFPFMSESKKWNRKGKRWFEIEIDYQIYEDGTHLQYSMNYHRVVVQLLTWAIRLSTLNNDSFGQKIYDKARKSLYFLDRCLHQNNGFLPNYGSNDGALFFKLSSTDYRDFRPQLDDLRSVLDATVAYDTDSHYWYGITDVTKTKIDPAGLFTFDKGGYYLVNEKESTTFIRCGSYKDRPAQADNLHIDIWIKGLNYLRDSGTFKYNTSKELLQYFMGSEGHNTLSVAGKDQMLKGARFIWFNWIKKSKALLREQADTAIFVGEIEAFREINPGIRHRRQVEKVKETFTWLVQDEIIGTDQEIIQYWHLNPNLEANIEILAKDELGKPIAAHREAAWYSSYYGVKETSVRIAFKSKTKKIATSINIKV